MYIEMDSVDRLVKKKVIQALFPFLTQITQFYKVKINSKTDFD